MAVLSFVLIMSLVGVWLAVLGRQAMPRAERAPISQWGWQDVVANIAIGYAQLVAVHERMRQPGIRRERPDA